MKQILLYTLPALIVGVSVYAIPNPTPEEMIEKQNRQAIISCLDSLSGSSIDIQKGASECSNTKFRSITGTATGGIAPVSPKRGSYNEINLGSDLERLYDMVCKKQINSPLCKDKELFVRLYLITEERLPMKQFYPILIGMTNAESSLGLDYAKDKVGGTCVGRNNWGGAKYMINDDNTRIYKRNLNGFDYKYPIDQFDCNLFPFQSVEEYWKSKVNGIRFGYKGCINSQTPIKCISYAYVGDRNTAEQSWIDNVSHFLQ